IRRKAQITSFINYEGLIAGALLRLIGTILSPSAGRASFGAVIVRMQSDDKLVLTCSMSYPCGNMYLRTKCLDT
ncbi:unnamed protein product, partial [Heterotrigona itama]